MENFIFVQFLSNHFSDVDNGVKFPCSMFIILSL